MGIKFTPLQDFTAEVNGSENHYIKGATYTVHDTPQHKDLAVKVQKWVRDRLVVVTGRSARPSKPHLVITR